MRKFIPLFIIAISTCFCLSAQNPTSISLGSGYANQSFYSFSNGEIVNVDNSNWDLGFSLEGFSATIRTNDGKGVELYTYHLGDTSSWSMINNSSSSSLTQPMYNSDTSWTIGAFDQNQLGHPDYGWGVYNQSTHYVVGDSLFIVKTVNGNWKKLWIESLTVSGEYLFKYANLDGSDLQSNSILKSSYSGKHFVYFSLDQNAILDREPLSTEWDITFTKYVTPVMGMAYGVTGVLSNTGIKVAKALNIGSAATYSDYSSHSFETEMNTIGYDWKSYQGGAYVLDPSRCYFVKDFNQNIWKIYFTGFDGMSTGNIEFNTELLSSTSIDYHSNFSKFNLYPNPAKEEVTIMIDTKEQEAEIEIFDLSGKLIFNKNVLGGFKAYNLDLSSYQKGFYVLAITINGVKSQKKLVIQ